MNTLRTGARTPFFATDIPTYYDLTADDFSPIEDLPGVPTLAELSACEVYIKSGFLVANATDDAGIVYVITWNEFQVHKRHRYTDAQTLALCAPIQIYLASGDWTMTPVVKVFQTTEQAEYPSTIDYINIGTIR